MTGASRGSASILLVIGGAAESLMAKPGKADLVLENRYPAVPCSALQCL